MAHYARSTTPNVSLRSSAPSVRVKVTPGANTTASTTYFSGKGYPIGLLLALTYTERQSYVTYPSLYAPNVRVSSLGVHNGIRSIIPSVRTKFAPSSSTVGNSTAFAGKGYPIGLLLALTYTAQQTTTSVSTYVSPYVPRVGIRYTNPHVSLKSSVPSIRTKVIPGVNREPYTTEFAGKGYPIGLLLALTYTQQQQVTFYPSLYAPNVHISTLNVHNDVRSLMPSVRVADKVGVPSTVTTTRYMLALALTSE